MGWHVLPMDFIRELRAVFAEYIPAGGYHDRPIPQQRVAAGAGGHVDVSGHGEHVTALLQSKPGGDQRTALFRGLHHQHAAAQAADDAVAHGKCPLCSRLPRGKLAENAAIGFHIPEQGPVRPGIHDIRAAAKNAYGLRSGGQRPGHCQPIDAVGHAGHHNAAAFSNLIAHALCYRQSVGRSLPGAHHADDRRSIEIRELTLAVEHRGRVGDVFQPGGIGGILQGQDAQPLFPALLQYFFGSVQIFVQQSGFGFRAQFQIPQRFLV